MTARRLDQVPVHLAPGGSIVAQPPMDGAAWYEDYAARTAGDGVDGRLVSSFAFDAPWESWEMHPDGDELVLCLSGRITLHQIFADGREVSMTLDPGDYAINPPGAWHTADTDGPAHALFITSGQGTRHRPR